MQKKLFQIGRSGLLQNKLNNKKPPSGQLGGLIIYSPLSTITSPSAPRYSATPPSNNRIWQNSPLGRARDLGGLHIKSVKCLYAKENRGRKKTSLERIEILP